MKKQTAGIHHISAIVGHPQENIDFYSGVLGLRLVKQTVNFDDPGTYHLYFGDGGGNPGTIITFFPWANARQGRIGDGQVGVTSYVVPTGALDFWEKRLTTFHVKVEKVKRFGETSLQFDDPHGLHLELVARGAGEENAWAVDDVTREVAIIGFGGATLYSSAPDETAATLTDVLGLEMMGVEGDYTRFRALADIGNIIDLKMVTGVRGTIGAGTVHHIAWRANDKADHLEWQEYAMNHGQHVTEVKDRNYFDAIYFRESGKILFEIATDLPGFAIDESPETMGTKLMLPPQFEQQREHLVQSLIPIQVPPNKVR
ncbi:ring-cleaving dioxygenase [Peribacillus sp. NPDC046944]|uniref:ring-cleaving dioxygenase n=1 Tax=unclassified Peribacillus TaxID=2675266 RepID=UPI003D0171D7